MKAAVFAYSRRGCETARRVRDFLSGDVFLYTLPRFDAPDFEPLGRPAEAFYGAAFEWADALIFVGSCGIAVREIAPHVKSKTSDPAVLCIDERGTFVIPLLSGHIGGANRLARNLAEALSALPVITTATDVNRLFAVDEWAAQKGFLLSDLGAAKAVSAEILERPVPLASAFPIRGELPAGVVCGTSGAVGIAVSVKTDEPFAKTLRVIPRALTLGIGCRKGTPQAALRAAVESALAAAHLDIRAVRAASSIDLKKEEAGLLAFCESLRIPITFYTAEQLREAPGTFSPSAFVKSVTGVDNVCERAAALSGGRLILKKTAANGVTVAAALDPVEVDFG